MSRKFSTFVSLIGVLDPIRKEMAAKVEAAIL